VYHVWFDGALKTVVVVQKVLHCQIFDVGGHGKAEQEGVRQRALLAAV
jgi:hypothetical protein